MVPYATLPATRLRRGSAGPGAAAARAGCSKEQPHYAVWRPGCGAARSGLWACRTDRARKYHACEPFPPTGCTWPGPIPYCRQTS
eukprot:4622514-Pyramimonas_sp.AAC.1